MRSAAHRDIDQWPHEKAFRLHDRMQRITFDVLLRAVLAIKDAALLARLLELVPALFANAGPIMMIQALQRDSDHTPRPAREGPPTVDRPAPAACR